MSWFSWLIVILPMCGILWAAFYSKRYVKDVADYLACGRVAGRYVISVGDMAAGLSVITLVAACEANYQVGIAVAFWGAVSTPLWVFLALSGFCIYRFRQTRCLSMGQFLEQRYSRSFRIVAATIRTISEMISNAIGPAIAVRFFIYFLNIPHYVNVFGFEIKTYGIIVALLLLIALAIIWPAGRISLLITDSIQGIMSYPIFVIFTVFILMHLSWFQDVVPVMLDRAPKESFMNPMDISGIRDFNLFAIFVALFSGVVNRAAWIGNDTSGAARNPHEQKMAGILGTWRNGFSYTMLSLIAIFLITFMLVDKHSSEANNVRKRLTAKVAEEVIPDVALRAKVVANTDALPAVRHTIGVDAPYSRTTNPDTPFLDTTLKTLREGSVKEAEANAIFQKFRSLYGQMMGPILLGGLFSPLLMGLFTLLMMMLLISTDDTRIFNASSTIIQDIVVPLRKKEMSVKEHLKYLKGCTASVAVFFFIVSLFFAQLDYINMFVMIMTGLWLGAAGPIMLFGLYSRFGTTVGAWSALVFGSGTSLIGLLLQRNWASRVYPWLDAHHYLGPITRFFDVVTAHLQPFIVWKMDAIKFPINSIEIFFIAMVFGMVAYIAGSLLTLKEPFNLDRLLHRGKYHPDGEEVKDTTKMTVGRFIFTRLVGITSEYTRGDKILAWSVFIWSIVYGFGIMFCGVLIWNAISPWPAVRWGSYYFITSIVTAILVGSVSTVWFVIGGVIDMRAMFRDLAKRIANPLDDGRVVGHVSLADKAKFEAIESEENNPKQ